MRLGFVRAGGGRLAAVGSRRLCRGCRMGCCATWRIRSRSGRAAAWVVVGLAVPAGMALVCGVDELVEVAFGAFGGYVLIAELETILVELLEELDPTRS